MKTELAEALMKEDQSKDFKHNILPEECQQKLREALNAGPPSSLKRSVAINAAVKWCKEHYPELFRKNESSY